MADVEEFAEGLVCLTGGEEGPLAAALARGGEKEGYKTVERLVAIFGAKNVFVELQRHGQREQEWRNQAAVRIARSLGLPILATNGVRYADEPEREIADLFTAIRHHVSLENAGRLLATNACPASASGERDDAALSRSAGGDREYMGAFAAADVRVGRSWL